MVKFVLDRKLQRVARGCQSHIVCIFAFSLVRLRASQDSRWGLERNNAKRRVYDRTRSDEGSTFRIYLPRLPVAEVTVERADTPLARLRESMTVLVADDEAGVRKLAARILRTRGYSVLEAASGAEALVVAREAARTRREAGRTRGEHEQKAASKAEASTAHVETRFPGVDRDHDGVIKRAEWRGDDASFANRDWNHDGVLSGNEMKPGAVRPALRRSASNPPTAAAATPAPVAARTTPIRRSSAPDPDGPVFARLDTNHDGVLTRAEWPDERFSRVDFNHDGVLSAYEYGVGR